MTEHKLANRIPFEDIKTVESWTLPNVTGKQVKSSRVQKTERDSETVEDVRPEDLKAVTAEQLQKVAQAAEDEGREKGYQDGMHQGFTEGEKNGLKIGEQRAYSETRKLLEQKAQTFQSLADALFDPVNMQDKALENTIVAMAVHFAKYLIDGELTQDPSSLFKIVERAVNSLPAGAPNIRIYLHADDAELAHEAFEGSSRNWTFHVDSKLSRGGCRVETDQSLIDYSIEQRLKIMLEKVDYNGDVDSDDVDAVENYSPEHESPPDDEGLDDEGVDGESLDDEGLDVEN